MAEEEEKRQRPDFRAVSSQITYADRSLARSRAKEATGQAESLYGKVSMSDFGSRATAEKPLSVKKDTKRSTTASSSVSMAKKLIRGSQKALYEDDSNELYKYRPKTRETQMSFDLLMNLVSQMMGDVPREVALSATDDLLITLKSDMKDFDKKKKSEEILGSLDAEKFSQIMNLSGKLNDYFDEEVQGDDLDESGVAVVFEDNEAEDEEEFVADAEPEDDEDEEGAGSQNEEEIAEMEEDLMEEEKQIESLDPREIDAHWLQRQISLHFADPMQSQEIAMKAFHILENVSDTRELENKLVMLLEYDKFELVKSLILNQFEIVNCIRLSRSDAEEKEKLTADLKGTEKGRILLSKLSSQVIEKGATKESSMMEVDKKDFGAIETVDLESLAFEQGSHIMTNKKVKLPDQSFKKIRKGFEEIHIPAPPTPTVDSKELLNIQEALPQWTWSAFPSTSTLNRVQSALFPSTFEGDENLLLCAPTGAGKTNVAMMTILREISKNMDSNGIVNLNAFKIVYIAPMKALVSEVVGNFSRRLSALGIQVSELTGDRQLTKKQIMETQVIVTTPEKWDVITRKNNDRSYTRLVRLIIIDEIHLLHDERGPVLESIVARTLRQEEQNKELVRLVALSATLPNFEDVARFLRVPPQNVFYFDSSYRPVPLKQQFIGLAEKKAFKRLQMMNEICYEKALEKVGKKQVLVFVHSRKETVKTARALIQLFVERETIREILGSNSGSMEILKSEALNAKSAELAELLPYGIGVHHAGLCRSDRQLMEDLFADKHLQILVSTSTLAWGVNLPAHTVIIKGTQVYSPEKGKWTELSIQDVLQMFGRAGRPQYDTEGEGIIITTSKEMSFYLSLLNQQLPIESQLVAKLVDNLNAEIVLGTVKNRADAVQWLGYSFLYVRMLQDPQLYLGLSDSELDVIAEIDPLLEAKRMELVHSAALMLDKAMMIKYDRKSGMFVSTELGRIASHYYLSHSTMLAFNANLKPHMNDIDIFRVFSMAREFSLIPVREEEKIELAKFIEKVPIPIKESVESPSTKVNILLQSYISQLKLEGFALLSDMVFIAQSANRIFRALFEIALKSGWARLSLRLLELCKCVEKRMWSCYSPLRQFTKQHSMASPARQSEIDAIPIEIVKKLEKKDFSFDRLFDLNVQEVGELLKAPKQAKMIHKLIHQFPKFELNATIQPISRSTLKIFLNLTPSFVFDEKLHSSAELFWILVTDGDNELLLHVDQFLLKRAHATFSHDLDFTVTLTDPLPANYFVAVVSDRWIASETRLALSFKNLHLPEKNHPPMEMLDLQPLSLSTVLMQDDLSEAFIKMLQFPTLNAVQSQAFNAVMNSSENMLVCAVDGAGKDTIAALSIFKHLKEENKGKIVYLNPHPVELPFAYEKIGLQVSYLTGDMTGDLKLLEKSDLIVATPHQWDQLSRRWKQRKAVQAVSLVIATQLHYLGTEVGPSYEIVLSRMRYMASQMSKEIRIVALSAPIANYKDFCDWLGIPQSNQFCYSASMRPYQLNVEIIGFSNRHVPSQLLSMHRPIFDAIRNYNQAGVVIFVPSRKNGLLLADDLAAYLHTQSFNLPRIAESFDSSLIKDEEERFYAEQGIGFVYVGQSRKQREFQSKLFALGALSVLIVDREEALEFPLKCGMSIVAGTCYYEGKEHRYREYSLALLLSMIGKASSSMHAQRHAIVMTSQGRRKFYEKFLFEPLPVESHIEQFLHDHFNAEIVTKTIENKQEAVDYLTWTFMYRRLGKNPNYYGMEGSTHRHISDHLSQVVENVIVDLVNSKLVELEDDFELSVSNLGMIAAYYSVNYLTIEMFASSLKPTTRLKGLLEIISASTEFADILTMRGESEEDLLEKMSAVVPIMPALHGNWEEPSVKVNLLLQSHLCRLTIPFELEHDQRIIVKRIIPLLYAIVDVASSNGWLTCSLMAMEFCQLIVQALFDRDSPLKQIPHFTPEIFEKCKEANIVTLFDFMDVDDEKRKWILSDLSAAQVSQVAQFVNSFPNVNVDLQAPSSATCNEDCSVVIQLSREDELDSDQTIVQAPFYPIIKEESWWLVIADPQEKSLLSIKRVTLKNSLVVKLDFTPSVAEAKKQFKLYFMSDSYVGADQEYDFEMSINEPEE